MTTKPPSPAKILLKMAISDVLRKTLCKISFAHSNGHPKIPPGTDADAYISCTHSHTFNSYSPDIASPPKRTFRFALSSASRKKHGGGNNNIANETHAAQRARALLERTLEKERAKKTKAALKDANRGGAGGKKRRAKRPPPCRMRSLESFSWASSGAGSSGHAREREEEADAGPGSDEVSPTNTRNNSRSGRSRVYGRAEGMCAGPRAAGRSGGDHRDGSFEAGEVHFSGVELAKLML